MAGSDKFVRDSRVLSRRVADGFLLLGPEDDTPTHVSGSCARVWDILDSKHAMAEIVAVATEESGVAEAEMAAMVTVSLDLLGSFVTSQSGSKGVAS